MTWRREYPGTKAWGHVGVSRKSRMGLSRSSQTISIDLGGSSRRLNHPQWIGKLWTCSQTLDVRTMQRWRKSIHWAKHLEKTVILKSGWQLTKSHSSSMLSRSCIFLGLVKRTMRIKNQKSGGGQDTQHAHGLAGYVYCSHKRVLWGAW